MSAKAPPKTFYQFRNVCYFLSGFSGYEIGQMQAGANKAAWTAYEQKKYAAAALAEPVKPSTSSLPEGVPAELAPLAAALTGKQ